RHYEPSDLVPVRLARGHWPRPQERERGGRLPALVERGDQAAERRHQLLPGYRQPRALSAAFLIQIKPRAGACGSMGSSTSPLSRLKGGPLEARPQARAFFFGAGEKAQ